MTEPALNVGLQSINSSRDPVTVCVRKWEQLEVLKHQHISCKILCD